MHAFLQNLLVSLDHHSYNNIAKRQEQYAVFSVLISPVSDRGKNTSLCYSQLPFLYIKGPHQSFPRTSHWELMLSDLSSLTSKSFPELSKAQSFYCSERNCQCSQKYYTYYTRRKVCCKLLFWMEKESVAMFPKSNVRNTHQKKN